MYGVGIVKFRQCSTCHCRSYRCNSCVAERLPAECSLYIFPAEIQYCIGLSKTRSNDRVCDHNQNHYPAPFQQVDASSDLYPIKAAHVSFFPGTFPFLFRQLSTPSSNSFLVTPSLTSGITTPRSSTFRFRLSSSKNSISLYSTPLFFWIFWKWLFLLPGYISK